MKRIVFLLVAAVGVVGVGAWMASSSLAQDNKAQANCGMAAGQTPGAQADGDEAKIVVVTTIPHGYRDWKFVSAAHEAGELNDIRVVMTSPQNFATGQN